MNNKILGLSMAVLSLVTLVTAAQAKPFIHPGILHTQADLDRMRKHVSVGTQPYLNGFKTLQNHSQSSSSYVVLGGFEETGRKPSVKSSQHESDANAAYQNAMMWAITGDQAHADKAIEILNAWSSTLKVISGRDKILCAGISGVKFTAAAEILRHTNSGWADVDIARMESMLKNIYYPVLKDMAVFANGNWALAALQTVMAIAVFTDDRVMFDHAVEWFYRGKDNARLTHYVINPEGQCQESGRDQQHTMLGLGYLAVVAEIAWNQGLDLYSAENNRILAGFEYTAAYNLGHDVPFQETTDTTGKYHHTKISPQGRGRFDNRPIFEMVYNHYKYRKGLDCPFTEAIVRKIRPEGSGFKGDYIGFGTILFARERVKSATDNSNLARVITIEENTDGFCRVDGVIEFEHEGFSGIGYANTTNALGTRVQWHVNAASAGTVKLAWRYASGDDRPASLYVNGSPVSSLAFTSTNAWTSWAVERSMINLVAGHNTICIKALTKSGLGNIDRLTLQGTGLTPDACDDVCVVRISPDDHDDIQGMPRDFALLPRDMKTNRAEFTVRGEVESDTWNSVELIVVGDTDGSNRYVGTVGDGRFEVTAAIPAGLQNHDIELNLLGPDRKESLAQAKDVVAGDVIVVQGQSNAVANHRGGGSSDGEKSEFLRSFGNHSEKAVEVEEDSSWYRAHGDAGYGKGAVGQWALRMGSLLVQYHQIPIAIINHSNGGKKIGFFQRSDTDPFNTYRNYGRLYYRLARSGLKRSHPGPYLLPRRSRSEQC